MTSGNVVTPFLEMRSFGREEAEVFLSEAAAPAQGSPFVSVYELEGYAERNPEQEAYAALVQDLYDEEFDEALFELLVEARGLHEEQLLASPLGIESERVLNQQMQQLMREAEATLSALGREFGNRPVASLTEAELDGFAARYAPTGSINPEFENFLGKWAKKIVKGVKGIAKKAGKFAVQLGLGPILEKIKPLARAMLEKVLQLAKGKLPESLRPVAQQLADRILGRRAPSAASGVPVATAPSLTPTAGGDVTAPPEDVGSAVQAPAGADMSELQQEFDQQLANLLTANDEVEMELEVARARSDMRREAQPIYAELDQARERFITELHELEEGEDPAPLIQNFLPAALPALRLGIRIVGRARVVNFLASFLAKMIAKLIGPSSAPALSRAIVDAGLKLLSLEVSPQDEARAAASAVAATVEETARRVAALPDYVLDNQELLEGFALEAFEQAAAANLPPVLSEAVYRERPELSESYHLRNTWVMLPLRSRKRYKKCGRTFKVRITPYMANEIESFEGMLSDYLQDQLGVEEGGEVEAEVHLYETLPGTTLPDIAREESETPSLRGVGAQNAAHLHPLTPKAAGMLFGEPRMGRVAPSWANRRRTGVGQRFYRLAIPGRRLLTVPGADGRPQPRRLGTMRVILDGTKNEIRVCIFLSEVKAQHLAVRLRKQAHAGAVATALQRYIARRLGPILRGERPTRIRVLHAGLMAGDAVTAALRRLPSEVAATLGNKITEYMVSAFAEFAKEQSQQFTAAAENTADGVTLKFTVQAPAGLAELSKALLPTGQAAGVAEALRTSTKPEVRVTVTPGLQCE